MKKKHKQMLLIAGCAVACIVLVAVIGSRFGNTTGDNLHCGRKQH